MFHLKSLLFITTLLISGQAHSSPDKNLTHKKISRNDIRAAKAVEDYYWSFKSKKYGRSTTAYKILKNSKSPLFKNLIPVFQIGNYIATENLNKVNECSFNLGKGHLDSFFLRQFKNRCFEVLLHRKLSSKSLFDDNYKKVIEENLETLLDYRYSSLFLRKIKNQKSEEEKSFYSNLLKNYIYQTTSLPNKEFLSHITFDNELTKFIQENKLMALGQKQVFTATFKKILSELRDNSYEYNDEEMREKLNQVISFYEENRENIDSSKAWQLFITSGKEIAQNQQIDVALALFQRSESIGEEDDLIESKFQQLFTYIQNGNKNEILNYINKEQLIDKFSDRSNKLSYWIARVYEDNKEFIKAKELYLKTISNNPMSFYSILALKQIRGIAPDYNVDLIVKEEGLTNNFETGAPLSRELAIYQAFNVADLEYFRAVQGSIIRRIPAHYFSNSENKEQSKSIKDYFLVKFFGDNDDFLTSFKVAYSGLKKKTIALNKYVISQLFPRKYSKLIHADNTNYDPKILLSLIRQESAFNIKAKSRVGARGLMQIMPATGKEFIRNLKPYKLYNPKLNIKIGKRYLERLIKRYDGNLIFALAAYNAGMGNVSKWQKRIPFTEDLIANIELIPFKETRNYVRLIYRNLFFYNYLDGNSSLMDKPLKETFKVALETFES